MAGVQISDLKALVVDDHIIVRKEIEKTLRALGCRHVDQAADAKEAAERMTATHYNVIFLDWNMPGRSGFNLLQQCREDESFSDVAFVIVSAESEDKYIIEALRAGATSYIVKPVSEPVLKEHVSKVLAWIDKRGGIARQRA